jgi:mannose-1-phosphate guanylyltransferase
MGLEHFYAVIMAGGGGTRLWPLSRSNHPKQMLKIGSQRTLFQQAVERIRGVFPPERILVVTVQSQAEGLMEEAPEIPQENFLLEPSPRGTASVVGLAACVLALRDKDAVMAILTADHIIGDTALFSDLLKASYDAAETGKLVTLGVPPEYPSSGYGYLQRGRAAGVFQGFSAFEVLKFKEKPDTATAQKYLASGDHEWNSGMFFWRVDRILVEFQRLMPELYTALEEIRAAWNTNQQKNVLAAEWGKIQPQTIDFGIMENARNVVVIPAPDLRWSDVGSWDSLFGVIEPDVNGNIILNHSQIVGNLSDSLLHESDPEKIFASVGLKDMIIIDTPDALMICPRGDSERIRELVIKLKEAGDQRYL